jgi:hypothetical protein
MFRQSATVEDGSLRSHLNAAIKHYLTKDAGWIHRSTGRAERYQQTIDAIDDTELATSVLKDIRDKSGKGPLGTSRTLRKRLAQGMCQFYNISDADISANTRTLAVTMYGYSAALVEAERYEATYNLIQARIARAPSVEMKLSPSK